MSGTLAKRMKDEMVVRSEWKQLLWAPIIAITLGVFAWVAVAGIWYFTPDDEQKELSFSELLAAALPITTIFALLLVLLIPWIIWCRLWSWRLTERKLKIYFGSRLVGSVPLESVESISFYKWSLYAHSSALRYDRSLYFIPRHTAQMVIDRWVRKRANKSEDST